jgi:hypothetical protein
LIDLCANDGYGDGYANADDVDAEFWLIDCVLDTAQQLQDLVSSQRLVAVGDLASMNPNSQMSKSEDHLGGVIV